MSEARGADDADLADGSREADQVRRTRTEFGTALVLDLIGSAGAVFIAFRTWQVITTHLPRPRPDDVLGVSGRAIDSAPLAFALVALAGVVAVLATRGVLRRVVGVVIVLAGVGLVWRAITSAGTLPAGRARSLVQDTHQAVSVAGATAQVVDARAVWPWLTVGCGVLVVAGGALVAGRGQRWRAMSARYESDPSKAADPARAAASMWSALDRGEDPTSRERA